MQKSIKVIDLPYLKTWNIDTWLRQHCRLMCFFRTKITRHAQDLHNTCSSPFDNDVKGHLLTFSCRYNRAGVFKVHSVHCICYGCWQAGRCGFRKTENSEFIYNFRQNKSGSFEYYLHQARAYTIGSWRKEKVRALHVSRTLETRTEL